MEKDISYLLSLQAVRQRAQLVFEAAQQGSLHSFEYDTTRLPDAAKFVISVIEVGACSP